MNPVIQITDLCKSFRTSLFRGERVEALKGISFRVEPGEVFGCLGRNGAGKTTTQKLLTGLLRPDRGAAELFGRPSGSPASRRKLGYLPENPYFSEHLTPREGLQLYGRLSGMSAAKIQRRSAPLLDRVGLSAAADRRMRSFSKGMRQRFGLAAALIGDPELLLLDEPLSGLDPAGRHLVKEIVQDEAAAGRTVMMSSHVLADVEELCERIVVLHNGEVVRDGLIAEMLSAVPSGFELGVEGASPALAATLRRHAMRCREQPQRLTVQLEGPDLGPLLASAAHAEGARVVSLVPQQETLEEWFVRMTDDAGVEPVEAVAAQEVSVS
jgi:ABC-2 type transport system ATP-binding protein